MLTYLFCITDLSPMHRLLISFLSIFDVRTPYKYINMLRDDLSLKHFFLFSISNGIYFNNDGFKIGLT